MAVAYGLDDLAAKSSALESQSRGVDLPSMTQPVTTSPPTTTSTASTTNIPITATTIGLYNGNELVGTTTVSGSVSVSTNGSSTTVVVQIYIHSDYTNSESIPILPSNPVLSTSSGIYNMYSIESRPSIIPVSVPGQLYTTQAYSRTVSSDVISVTQNYSSLAYNPGNWGGKSISPCQLTVDLQNPKNPPTWSNSTVIPMEIPGFDNWAPTLPPIP